MTLEGVDYSATAGSNWNALAAALKANGKHFAGRYAVNDKSPNGRGITAEEYQALTNAGIEVFLYWQTTTNWMLGGEAAGIAGAVNAQNNITAAGMPTAMPVYFACDFDATPEQQDDIDACLRGAAKVLGAERVGLYAGYYPLMRAMQNGTARWLCQTTAWSGGQRLPQAHLYQYEYNQFYGGTNCDDVRAYQENYGQASKFVGGAPVDPAEPAPLQPKPITWEVGDSGVIDYHGTKVYSLVAEVTCKRLTTPRIAASTKAKSTGPKIEPNEKVTVVGTLDSPWYIVAREDGTYPRVSRTAFYPSLPRPRDAA